MQYPTDKEAADHLQSAIDAMNAYYQERGIFQDGDLEFAIKLMEQHGTFEEIKNLTEKYISVACDELACLPESASRQALVDAARFCVSRVY